MKISFLEAVNIIKKGNSVYFGEDKQQINIFSDLAVISYELTLEELIYGEWYVDYKKMP